MTTDWPIYRLRVDEYEHLTASGFWNEDADIELLEGCLVPKMPKPPLHDGSIGIISELLQRRALPGWMIRHHSSVVTTDSVPMPDLSIVRGAPGSYRLRHPRGSDVGVVIEVAVSSTDHDRKKAAIYARAAAPEYWIVNLDDWQLERMTQPQEDGTYASTEIFKADSEVPVILDGQEFGRLTLRELLTPPAAQE